MGKLDEIKRTTAALEKSNRTFQPNCLPQKWVSAFASLPDFHTHDTDVCDAAASTAFHVVALTASSGRTASKGYTTTTIMMMTIRIESTP
jgi:hypothetical protein